MHEESIDVRLSNITDCLYRVSAKAVIVREGKILLVQETEKWWSLPGGGIDHGETVTQALQRELAEELQLRPEQITIDQHVLQAVLDHIVEHIPRIALLYKTEISADVIQKTDHILGMGWFTAQEVEQLYVSPTVGGASEVLRRMVD
jgi:8-oxo-dGTP pyrophosphatase MutT (NUDIX family)